MIVKRAKLAHEAKCSNLALYGATDTGRVNFIMSVVDKTCYKKLEDADTFYKNVTAQQLLKHLEDHCTGLHVIDAVDIPSVVQTFCTEAEGVPQYINIMEIAQMKSVSTPLPVTDEIMQVIAFTAILASGEYPNDMREWQMLTPADQKWDKWENQVPACLRSQGAERQGKGHSWAAVWWPSHCTGTAPVGPATSDQPNGRHTCGLP